MKTTTLLRKCLLRYQLVRSPDYKCSGRSMSFARAYAALYCATLIELAFSFYSATCFCRRTWPWRVSGWEACSRSLPSLVAFLNKFIVLSANVQTFLQALTRACRSHCRGYPGLALCRPAALLRFPSIRHWPSRSDRPSSLSTTALALGPN